MKKQELLTNMKKILKISLSFPLIITTFLMIIATGNSSNAVVSPLVPALYIFGDSLLDNGNNNLLPTLAKANFLPYGMNFNKGPTGRFTNGRTVVDFIAEFLGLSYPPPFLSIRTLLSSDKLTGLNFASGSCGILPETGDDLGKCLNFGEQIDLFKRTVEEDLPKKFNNSSELSDYLSRSMYVISIGSNDYINNYLDTQHFDTSKRYSPQSFARFIIHQLSQQLQRLYEVGAKKVLVFEIGPIGCIPSIVRQYKHNGRCHEEINGLAIIFNNLLSSLLPNLTSTLKDSNFILGHAHSLGYDAIINPSNYGLKDSMNPCCITWMNGTSACIPEVGALACRNPNEHYFFDGYHLTETLYKLIATRCFNGSDVCLPQNIQELLQQ